jgi:hypothetical protein
MTWTACGVNVDRCRNCSNQINRAFITHCPDCGTPGSNIRTQHNSPQRRRRFNMSERTRQGLTKTLMGFVVVGAMVVSAFGGAHRDADGSLTQSETLLPTALRVGDCLDLPIDAQVSFGSVRAVPCDEPHHLEKYLDASHPAQPHGDWPGDEAIGDWAVDRCHAGFEPYVGRAYEDALELDFYYFYPSPQAWGSGERQVQCFVMRSDRSPVVGTVASA